MNREKLLHIHDEVREALESHKSIVALESTIIAHGMPYPENVKTALEVEKLIRHHGAIPATIALLDGKLCIGLKQEQIEILGNSKSAWKVSIRDIPFVLTKRFAGATTVAATMRIAHLAGIKVFVTGGIGGVHREAQQTFDISADLIEFAESPVAVVSAGAKSILDIGLTLEYLETKGVPVVTVGQDTFPAFYSRDSGYASPLRIDEPEVIARMIRTKWELGMRGGVLIANPIPAEAEIPFSTMEEIIDKALTAAKQNNISGKRLTPFLLQYISEQTGGRSLTANIALVKNNARLGAVMARFL